jgi:hypothetical protein
VSAPLAPTEVRMFFGPPVPEMQLSQVDYGRRTTIIARRVEVNYWVRVLPSGSAFRWYVVVEGRRVRQSDGEVSRSIGRIAYWPNDGDMGHRPEAVIDAAPKWVRDIFDAAQQIVEGLDVLA